MITRTQIVCLRSLSLFLLFVHPNTYSAFSTDLSSVLYFYEISLDGYFIHLADLR
jgi:hypothetical protein